jgi:protein gp37
MNLRFGNGIPYDNRPVDFELDLTCFDKLPKTKPGIVFVQSMGDLFHEQINYLLIDAVINKIFKARQHKFLILTKRPQRMKEYFDLNLEYKMYPEHQIISNLWLGVTAENQEMADKRIPILLQIPAAKRFVSIEPMLGAVDLSRFLKEDEIINYDHPCHLSGITEQYTPKLDWVILGAESGPKKRYCQWNWMFNVAKQCKEADIPLFVKQIHFASGNLLHGPIKHWISKDITEWPAELQRQEMPG